MKQRKLRFRVLKSKAKQPYHWICLSNNNKILCHSENYVHKGGAFNSIRKFTKHMPDGIAEVEDHT